MRNSLRIFDFYSLLRGITVHHLSTVSGTPLPVRGPQRAGTAAGTPVSDSSDQLRRKPPAKPMFSPMMICSISAVKRWMMPVTSHGKGFLVVQSRPLVGHATRCDENGFGDRSRIGRIVHQAQVGSAGGGESRTAGLAARQRHAQDDRIGMRRRDVLPC